LLLHLPTGGDDFSTHVNMLREHRFIILVSVQILYPDPHDRLLDHVLRTIYFMLCTIKPCYHPEEQIHIKTVLINYMYDGHGMMKRIISPKLHT
jgi:hypothetical protein